MIDKTRMVNQSLSLLHSFLDGHFASLEGFETVKVKKSYIGFEDLPLGDRVVICLSSNTDPVKEESRKMETKDIQTVEYELRIDLDVFAHVENDLFLEDVFNQLVNALTVQNRVLFRQGFRVHAIRHRNKSKPDANKNVNITAVLFAYI
ncbi:hypothetical protein [Paenibacillus contaminans]|uniref:Uncharacterized protein n=1 Tax=Paenibacillus contaminans TaxID=450362 RepID=A0A329MYH2_9BACL|nr:hypothetical protein [Paenibacillus contaminans]RAV22677.1 hypothetical protein DQG23_00200 [Paenibacillus contaminans]